MFNYEEMNVMYHKQFLDGYSFGFNFWVDCNDVYWFSYDDVCENLEFTSKKSKYYFTHNIDNCDKCTICVLNYKNMFNEERAEIKDFINYNALMRLIDRNIARKNSFAKVIHGLYTKLESCCNYNEDDKLNKLMNDFNENKNKKNYEDMFINIHDIYNTQTCRDILDKVGLLDKEKEELIDLLREDIYSYEDFEEIDLIIKRKDNDIVSKYEKYNGETTAPSWLRTIFK